jgi:hypothetical protein
MDLTIGSPWLTKTELKAAVVKSYPTPYAVGKQPLSYWVRPLASFLQGGMMGVDMNYERSILSLLVDGVWLGIMLMPPSFDAYSHKSIPIKTFTRATAWAWKCIVNSIT